MAVSIEARPGPITGMSKRAAESESLLLGNYGREDEPGMYLEGLRRMATAVWSHLDGGPDFRRQLGVFHGAKAR